MAADKDDRKRSHLRLVVDNAEKRKSRPAVSDEVFIPIGELIDQRDALRPRFYQDMERNYVKIYKAIERFFSSKQMPYAFDPCHGPLIVIPASAVFLESAGQDETGQDEILLYLAEDAADGLCLSLEMLLPFYSEDEAVMEDALLFSPVFQYGTLFLEEDRHENHLDLIYRFGFPLYPPALTEKILDRLFSIVALELTEALKCLAEFSEGG